MSLAFSLMERAKYSSTDWSSFELLGLAPHRVTMVAKLARRIHHKPFGSAQAEVRMAKCNAQLFLSIGHFPSLVSLQSLRFI